MALIHSSDSSNLYEGSCHLSHCTNGGQQHPPDAYESYRCPAFRVLTVRTAPVKGKRQSFFPESGDSEGGRLYLDSHALVPQLTVKGRDWAVMQVPFGPQAPSPSLGDPEVPGTCTQLTSDQWEVRTWQGMWAVPGAVRHSQVLLWPNLSPGSKAGWGCST